MVLVLLSKQLVSCQYQDARRRVVVVAAVIFPILRITLCQALCLALCILTLTLFHSKPGVLGCSARTHTHLGHSRPLAPEPVLGTISLHFV